MSWVSLEASLAAKLDEAWDSGCPVGGSTIEVRAELAVLARRRWNSFERRQSPHSEDTPANQIEDLAQGLCEAGGAKRAGALISDYRWLAAQLAEVINDQNTSA